MPTNKETKAIILFDGFCNFCNSSVNFIIKHDRKNYFLFAALQSEKGKELLNKFKIDTQKTDTIILVENENYFIKSTAALKIAKHLNRLYPLLFALIIIPTFIRDFFYDLVAKSRYKWFGKKDTCMIPSEEIKSKFIS